MEAELIGCYGQDRLYYQTIVMGPYVYISNGRPLCYMTSLVMSCSVNVSGLFTHKIHSKIHTVYISCHGTITDLILQVICNIIHTVAPDFATDLSRLVVRILHLNIPLSRQKHTPQQS